jgi:aryl-alcohol dehydrogenase-like predicted oxidoreductase
MCTSDQHIYIIDSQSRPAVNGELALSPVVLGCATFGYGIYQDKSEIVSTLPVRVVRLALRAGITAFDTCVFPPPITSRN